MLLIMLASLRPSLMEAKGVAVSNGVPATVLQGGGLDLSLANQGFNSIDILADCFIFFSINFNLLNNAADSTISVHMKQLSSDCQFLNT